MKLYSMTGRGTGRARGRLACVEVELSSVNRKQFDLAIGWPRWMATLEARIQAKIQKTISRGRITGEIRVDWAETAHASSLRIRTGLARVQVNALRSLAQNLGLEDDLKASTLLSIPELVVCERRSADVEAVWPLVDRALGQAIRSLQTMRRKEGAALGRDVQVRFRHLHRHADAIGTRAPAVADTYRKNLLRRVGALLPGTHAIEDERLLKEIALFAERSDITEERVRLDSHRQQAEDLLRTGGVAGRTLDFVLQEMGREINTIGSKANDAAITRHVIAFKSELEKIREQIQNIE